VAQKGFQDMKAMCNIQQGMLDDRESTIHKQIHQAEYEIGLCFSTEGVVPAIKFIY
jgi:hypothetical protein